MTSPATTITERLTRLRGVVWEWRDDAPAEAQKQPGMGIIAQDVHAVFPELIGLTESDHLQVDYDGLIAALYAAVAEMAERLRALGDTTREGTGAVDDAEEVARAGRGERRTELDPDAIERIYPQLVSTDEHGVKTIAYHSLVGPLIEAIKELDGRLRALEQQRSAT